MVLDNQISLQRLVFKLKYFVAVFDYSGPAEN